jgi:hypothetical protein
MSDIIRKLAKPRAITIDGNNVSLPITLIHKTDSI